jgi:hypothetical protein
MPSFYVRLYAFTKDEKPTIVSSSIENHNRADMRIGL